MFVDAMGDQAVEATFRAWAMNTRHSAVTEYTAFPYNSFARYNGTYLAAGATGLFRMEGADDAGAEIPWDIVTGQMDGGDAGLKRITEVVAGLRCDRAVRVRVWKDDDESYEYSMPATRGAALHQARAKTGKGLRSRYYKVGLSGSGSSLELDSLQLTVPSTNRRVG
jgi:hypothetical protein